MSDFIYDSNRDFLENIPRNLCKVCSHAINGRYGTNTDRIVIRAAVAHDADGANTRQNGEVLPDFLVKTMLCDDFAQDGIGIAHDFELVFRNFANDADAKAWAREWLTPDEFMRNAELFAEFARFVLEERAQRFDQLEVHVFRKSANVVVRLDRLGRVRA